MQKSTLNTIKKAFSVEKRPKSVEKYRKSVEKTSIYFFPTHYN